MRQNNKAKNRNADFGSHNYDTDNYFQGLRKNIVVEQKPTPKPKKLFVLLGLVIVVLTASLLLILKPSLIGFVTAEKELAFNDTIGIDFASNSEYLWNVNNQGDIRSIKLSGQYENNTIARIYIENDNVKHLIVNTSKPVSYTHLTLPTTPYV